MNTTIKLMDLGVNKGCCQTHGRQRAKPWREHDLANGCCACVAHENVAMPVNQSTENPGRVIDRGLLCRAVLGERGGPPSRIVKA